PPEPAAPPDAPPLLEYSHDAVRFNYSPVFKLERTERDPVTILTLDSPRSPLIILNIYQADILPEAASVVMESNLENRLSAKGLGYKLVSKEPVRRRLDGDLREGERLVYGLGGARLTTEIYSMRSGFVTFSFLFQHAADDETEAAELFRVFSDSFRIW